MMLRAVVALAVLVVGLLVSGSAAAAQVILGQSAQDAASTTADGVWIPLASAGGSVASVGALVFIARLMATGKLVAREPAEVEATLQKLLDRASEDLTKANRREDEANRREDRYVNLVERLSQIPTEPRRQP